MTLIERQIAQALLKCSFIPGSFDKKFVKNLSNRIDKEMTDKGKRFMVILLHKYRRQISNYKELMEAVWVDSQIM